MAKLFDPRSTERKTVTPSGPSGFLDNPRQLVSPESSIGNSLIRMGNNIDDLVVQEKVRMDNVAVDDAKNQYITNALELEAEYGQIKGKNAVDQDIVADYTTKLNGLSESITGGFKNNDQRRAWEKFYGKSKVQFAAGVMKHKLAESDSYATNTYKSTNVTRTQNAHVNWSDDTVVDGSASDIVINIAREKARAGWGDERTEIELMATLGPLWSGVAAQYINAKQYKMAKKILDKHKEVIGVDKYTSYHKSIEASETIDLSQEKTANIMETVEGESAQRKAARDIGGNLGDATLERVKTIQTEKRLQKQADKKIGDENDIEWITDIGVEALEADTLTVEQIKSAGLSPKNEALWLDKYFKQGDSQRKELTNDKYADWIEKVALNPGKYTANDVAKDIDPNGGGLTGPQYRVILSDIAGDKQGKPKNTASVTATKSKQMLKSMYDRGDFGETKTGKKAKKTEAWKNYSDILIDLQQKTIEEPEVNHTDWLNDQLEEEGMRELYKKLDADWTWGPFSDESNDIITEWLKERGKAVNRQNIEAVKKRWKK